MVHLVTSVVERHKSVLGECCPHLDHVITYTVEVLYIVASAMFVVGSALFWPGLGTLQLGCRLFDVASLMFVILSLVAGAQLLQTRHRKKKENVVLDQQIAEKGAMITEGEKDAKQRLANLTKAKERLLQKRDDLYDLRASNLMSLRGLEEHLFQTHDDEAIDSEWLGNFSTTLRKRVEARTQLLKDEDEVLRDWELMNEDKEKLRADRAYNKRMREDLWKLKQARAYNPVTTKDIFEQTLYVLGSAIFMAGTIIWDPAFHKVDKVWWLSFADILFMVGSMMFAFAAFINAVSLSTEAQSMHHKVFQKYGMYIAASYQFGACLFIGGTMSFVPGMGCNEDMEALGCQLYIAGSVFYVVGTSLSLCRTAVIDFRAQEHEGKVTAIQSWWKTHGFKRELRKKQQQKIVGKVSDSVKHKLMGLLAKKRHVIEARQLRKDQAAQRIQESWKKKQDDKKAIEAADALYRWAPGGDYAIAQDILNEEEDFHGTRLEIERCLQNIHEEVTLDSIDDNHSSSEDEEDPEESAARAKESEDAEFRRTLNRAMRSGLTRTVTWARRTSTQKSEEQADISRPLLKMV